MGAPDRMEPAMTKRPLSASEACPCGSGQSYAQCCAPLHQGQPAATAEALMRSRYSAFVMANADYLLLSWHSTTRPAGDELEFDPRCRWLGLTIKGHQQQDDSHATVEFVARYQVNGRAFRLHETSNFVREQGQWRYVDGLIHPH